MDILRVLATPDLEVRKKTLQLALDLVSSRNVEEVRVFPQASASVTCLSPLSVTAGDGQPCQHIRKCFKIIYVRFTVLLW